jgi:hypothetical protein
MYVCIVSCYDNISLPFTIFPFSYPMLFASIQIPMSGQECVALSVLTTTAQLGVLVFLIIMIVVIVVVVVAILVHVNVMVAQS